MATTLGLLVKPDGTRDKFEGDTGNLLGSLYQAIGCELVQTVSVSGQDGEASEFTIWVDEESLLVGEPKINIALSVFAAARGVSATLFGNGVITGGVDEEGNTLGLTEEQLDRWLS